MFIARNNVGRWKETLCSRLSIWAAGATSWGYMMLTWIPLIFADKWVKLTICWVLCILEHGWVHLWHLAFPAMWPPPRRHFAKGAPGVILPLQASEKYGQTSRMKRLTSRSNEASGSCQTSSPVLDEAALVPTLTVPLCLSQKKEWKMWQRDQFSNYNFSKRY